MADVAGQAAIRRKFWYPSCQLAVKQVSWYIYNLLWSEVCVWKLFKYTLKYVNFRS
jgi:hypothetical protein